MSEIPPPPAPIPPPPGASPIPPEVPNQQAPALPTMPQVSSPQIPQVGQPQVPQGQQFTQDPPSQQPTQRFVGPSYGYAPPQAGPVALELRKIAAGWPIIASSLLVVVVVGLAMSASLIAMINATSSSISGSINIVQQLLIGMAAVLGGGLGISSSSSSLTGGVGIASIGTLAVIGVVVYLFTKRSVRREGPNTGSGVGIVVRSFVEALIVALIAMIITIFARVDLGIVIITPPLVGVLFSVWLCVGFAMTFARMRWRGVSRWGAARTLASEPVWYATIMTSVMSGLALIAFIVFSIDSEEPMVLAWFGYGANVGVYGAALGHLGQLEGLSMLAPMVPSTAMAWDILGEWSILVILLTIATMLYLAVFIGARRGRSFAFNPARIWQLPIGMFALTLLYTFTLGAITMGGSASSFLGSGHSEDRWIGLSFTTSLIVAGFALVVSILAELLPAAAYGIGAGFFSLLAGRRAAHAWVTGAPAAPASFQMAVPPSATGPVAPLAFGTAASAGAMQPGATQPIPPAGWSQASGQTVPQQFTQPQQFGQATPFTQPAPLPPRAPMSKRSKRRLIGTLVTVAVLGLLAGAGAIALTVINSTRGPEAAVEQYLTLIAEGKAEEASDMVSPGKGGDRDLLTNAVLGSDEVTRISVGKITSDIDGEFGTTTAQLKLGDKQFEVDIPVTQGEKEYGLLTTWEVSQPLVYEIEISSDRADTAIVSGTEVSLDAPGYSGTGFYLVYPGTYPVEVTGESKFYEADSADVAIGPRGNGSVSLTPTLSKDVSAAVLAKVQDFVTSCATVPTNMDSDCPYAVQNTELASITVTTQPSGFDSFSEDYRSFDSSEATITIVPNATTFNSNPTPREVDFTVSGDWEIDGDDIVVDIRWVF